MMTTGKSASTPSPLFDDPAFGDELERRTWMESYVVAYEVALLAAVAVAAAMVWFGGAPLRWWSVAVVGIIGLGNAVALGHLRRAGLTDLPWKDRMRFWSFRLRLLLIVAWAVGFLRLYLADTVPDLDAATIAGMVTGAVLVLGAIALAAYLVRRRTARELPEDDHFD